MARYCLNLPDWAKIGQNPKVATNEPLEDPSLAFSGLGYKSCQEEGEGSQYVNQLGQSGEDAVGG